MIQLPVHSDADVHCVILPANPIERKTKLNRVLHGVFSVNYQKPPDSPLASTGSFVVIRGQGHSLGEPPIGSDVETVCSRIATYVSPDPA
jgi:hypothetical protein